MDNTIKPNYQLSLNLKYENATIEQKEIFSIFDTNKDNEISASELKTFQKNFGTGAVSREKIDEYIDVFNKSFGQNVKRKKFDNFKLSEFIPTKENLKNIMNYSFDELKEILSPENLKKWAQNDPDKEFSFSEYGLISYEPSPHNSFRISVGNYCITMKGYCKYIQIYKDHTKYFSEIPGFSDDEEIYDSKGNKVSEKFKGVMISPRVKDLWNGKTVTSKVDNDFYKGGNYSIKKTDNIVTVKNKDDNKETKIDLDKLFEDYKESGEKEVMILNFLSLPAEAMIDIANEVTFANTDFMHGCDVAGAYRVMADRIEIAHPTSNDDQLQKTILHETGHAIDFKNLILPNGSIKGNRDFMDAYNREKKIFDNRDNEKDSGSNYAATNEAEMFAECYALLMLGDCQSKNCITTYFKDTLEEAKKHLELIRNKDISERRSFFRQTWF